MKKIFLTLAFMLSMATLANATFTKDPNPGGDKLFIIDTNKGVDTFYGSVAVNNSTQMLKTVTTGKVNTGNGYSNIKPVKDGTLTDLLFTPVSGYRYSEFSFRGQLINSTGAVNVNVVDNFGTLFTFTFNVSTQNSGDYFSIGVISTDGEWFKSVDVFTTTGSFKELKQIELSSWEDSSTVPEPGTMILLGVGLAGLAIFGKRRMNRE